MKSLTIPLPLAHPLRITWNLVIVVAIWVSSLTVSYVTVVGSGRADIAYAFFTVAFFLDVFVNLCSAQRRGHRIITDQSTIIMHYLRTWLIIDLLAALPFLALLAQSGNDAGMRTAAVLLGLVRIVKLVKVPHIMAELQDSLTVNPPIMRLVLFAFWFTLVCHFMALGWILIGAAESGRPPFDMYLRSLYWCLTTVATIGYGDYSPNHESNVQIIYTMVVQVFGVAMYGYIIGNVSGLIANLDAAKAEFLRKTESVNRFMRAHKIPLRDQERVRDYYNYLWYTKGGTGSSDIISDLPHTLSSDIFLFIHQDILRKVALFRDADELFVREVVQLLKPVLFLPDDFIIREGASGDCMYFLDEGEAEVLIGNRRVSLLAVGSAFGETALIRDEKRNASIRAITYCHAYMLSKEDFNDLREKHPPFDMQIRRISESYGKSDPS
jgi:hypothetical protein